MSNTDELKKRLAASKMMDEHGPDTMQEWVDQYLKAKKAQTPVNPLAKYIPIDSAKLSPLDEPLPQLTAADDIYGSDNVLPPVKPIDEPIGQEVPLRVSDNLPVDLTRPDANAGIPPEFNNPINDLSKYIARPAEPEINQVLNPATSQLDVKDTSNMVGTDESGGVYPQEDEETPLNETDEQKKLDLEGAASKLALLNSQAPAELAPTEVPQTQAPVDNFDRQLADAREQDRQSSLLMGLLKASQMGGAALAGSKADTSYADAELAKGNQATNRLKTDSDMREQQANILQKREKRDPESKQSKMYQGILQKLNPGMDVAGLSAEDVEKAFPSIAAAVGRQDALEASSENRKLVREGQAATKVEKKELQDEKQGLEVQKTVDKLVNNLRTSDDFKTYQATKSAQAALDAAITSGNKTETGSAFMLYAKIAQGDNSVVRESDMKNLAGTYNYSSPAEMFSKLSAKASGGNFSAGELQQMKKVASLIQKIKAKHIREQLEPIQTRIKNHGLDPNETISPEIVREFANDPELKFAEKSTTVSKAAPQNTGTVTIKSKKTGTTKTLSAESAAKYLKDPNFERVN